MRLFLVILLAGAVSIGAGIGAEVLTSYLPNNDDPAGRGLGEVFRIGFVLAYAVVAMVALGISARALNREHVLKITMLVLCALPLMVSFLGCANDLSHRAGFYEIRGQIVSVIQIVLPLWIMVAVQWLILRHYMRRHGRGLGPARPGGSRDSR